MTKTIGLAALAAVVALGGCQTARDLRARIVRAPPQCVDEVVPVYFRPGTAELTPEGRQVIAAAVTRARACKVNAVTIMGLAAATGSPEVNFEESQRRANAVTGLLAAGGLTSTELQVLAGGEQGAITVDGKADPLRRRTEISFDLSPR